MKYLSLIGLVVLVVALCIWQQVNQPVITNDQQRALENTGVKWNDSLFKYLPSEIDTSIIVQDSKGTPLQFYQYVKPVFNYEAIIYQDRGVWKLHRLNESAADSLRKDDDAVASRDRWDAYRNRDVSTNWRAKLDAIAHTLAQSDYVLVIKHKRKMYVSRKGKPVLTFEIDMGWAPMGHKEKDGDGKTPEGIYHLDNKFNRSDKFHKSIHISYPNFKDKENAKKKGIKPGFGIEIHGTYLAKVDAKDWTAGCIALQNNEMDILFEHVGNGTIIEIRK